MENQSPKSNKEYEVNERGFVGWDRINKEIWD